VFGNEMLRRISGPKRKKYACETLTLKEAIKIRLLVFGRKMLRKIFGPSRNHDSS
jgi:hypothetical protein